MRVKHYCSQLFQAVQGHIIGSDSPNHTQTCTMQFTFLLLPIFFSNCNIVSLTMLYTCINYQRGYLTDLFSESLAIISFRVVNGHNKVHACTSFLYCIVSYVDCAGSNLIDIVYGTRK